MKSTQANAIVSKYTVIQTYCIEVKNMLPCVIFQLEILEIILI